MRSRYLADRAAALSEALTRALIRRLRRRDIAHHLEDLPDYLLRDIGIERHQVPALAAGSLKRPKSSLATAVCHRVADLFRPATVATEAANDRRDLAA